MRSSKWTRTAFAAVLAAPLFAVVAAVPAAAQAPGAYDARPLSAASRVDGAKAPTSRLAQTDRTLLGRTDAARVPVMIKFDYDSIATYQGGVRGLAATSPSVTGRALSTAAAERRYESYLAGREAAILGALQRRVPGLTVHQRLRVIYGGVSATVPANRIEDLLGVAGVVAVQRDELRAPLTDSSPAFIGANTIYPQLGGDKNAGKGVIFGVLDTGAWPEHPSFADQGHLPAPPPKADGTPRACNFGDNPLTPAADPFACTNKLIGGAPFLATYLSDPDRASREPYHTARDSNGHGTHTGSTAAGNVLASAKVFGVERGPVKGVAPGAYVSVYKVCGIDGCFGSDSAAAVQQAILDGVKVINFSISGGTNPFSDPVELAFLDAYAAGVLVAASAGNAGPGAATVNHVSPWVTTVAASTQRREYVSTLTLSSGGDTLTLTGASITAGAGPAQVVLASAAPYSNANCTAPAAPGTFTGKIVACRRGVNARVDKGYNVLQGGAVGMILYNPALQDIETDNHWLPTVHLADGTQFLGFMGAHAEVTASFTAGQKVNGQGDVMAAFSSRGPGGLGLKPDITAPGVQILAGHTPTPESSTEGPPGEYFQAIAGTSMSSPHIAGSALLLRALHPTWTPGQVKSAMMTTAHKGVVKEDTVTPATPFDYGSGRVNLRVADTPGLTFDESAARMAALGNDPVNAVHLNLPSVNAPVMPGRLTTVRTARNVTGQTQTYRAATSAPSGSRITVRPAVFTLGAGQSIELSVTIESSAPTGQYFGEVRLNPDRIGLPTLHLPVAFVPKQGSVSLTSTCDPASVVKGSTSVCTITARNESFGEAEVDLTTTLNDRLKVVGASGGAHIVGDRRVELRNVHLAGASAGVPGIEPGASPAGYLPLSMFGIPPTSVGDETILNYNVPAFVFAGESYTRLGVDSNGYLVVGGGTAEDNNCCNLTQIPDPARPNNVLAPFWTDLDGTAAPGIYIATLTDGTNTWLVVEWQVNVFGTSSNRHFQVWIGVNGTEDISLVYDPAALPADPAGQAFLVGAENKVGTGGEQLPAGVLPTEDLRVTSTPPTPGAAVSYTVTVKGVAIGTGRVTTTMDSPQVPGLTVVTSQVQVTYSALGRTAR